MKYSLNTNLLPSRNVWLIELENDFSKDQTLLLSKVSEAVRPNTVGNHIGVGATMDEFLTHQPGVKFVINGGYNHYRKDFYDWAHNEFNVGDPVGLVKIREHYFEDMLDRVDIEHFGFFTQPSKGMPWQIVKYPELSKREKYILGCTPLLIYEGQKTALPLEKMKAFPPGVINPPSVLGHGLQYHPRTAVGIKHNQLIFLLVEADNKLGGCTLPELQELGSQLKLDALLNLDGGGSSQFRLYDNDQWIGNYVPPEDKNRVLGNVVVLFENALPSQGNK